MLLDIGIVLTTAAEGEVVTARKHKGGVCVAGNGMVARIWELVI